MAEKETKDILCPFCGAPYRKLVRQDALQLKCDYCGATFHIPPRLGVEIPRCRNHPDRFATGICNDCGQSFCSDCLTAFPFVTEGARAMLYLCPNCFRRRNLDKADQNILTAALLLVLGVPFTIFSWAYGSPYWLLGAFLTLLGAIWGWYGMGLRNEVTPEPTPETGVSEEEDETGPTSEGDEAEEAERLYDQLFTEYVEHWGIQSGAQILDSEIRAYTMHGETYAEALRKITERNKKKAH